ncbi:condensation domain-containing protein, partial [Paenibacillus glycinis]
LYAGEELAALRIQYKDYAAWQQERQFSEAMKEHESYWLNRFAGQLPVLQLPADYPRPAKQRFEGNWVTFTLNEAITSELRRLVNETGTTLYMVLLTMYKVMLYQYTEQEDIIVGTPISGRGHESLERLIGMFVNTLALRSYPTGNKAFAEFLEEVKQQTLEAFEHEEYPFEGLVEQLNKVPDASRNPLFDTMFVLQNMGLPHLELPKLLITPYEFKNRVAKFDLLLEASEGAKEIKCRLNYNTALFKDKTAERMADYFLSLIEFIMNNRYVALKDIPLSSKKRDRFIEEEIRFNF